MASWLMRVMETMGVEPKAWHHTLVTDDEVTIRFKENGKFYSLTIKEVDSFG